MELAKPNIFLSYNSADQEYVRKLAATLLLSGAQVWFDQWVIRPGDSIPTAVDTGLSRFDIYALVWTKAASQSNWVHVEMNSALSRYLKGDRCRLVPIRLDDTEIPQLLSSIRYIDGRNGNHIRVTQELLGIDSDVDFRLAIQSVIEEVGLEFREFPGVGVLVACPKCGATVDNLQGWQDVDSERDDIYIGVRCIKCGWSDGSEL